VFHEVHLQALGDEGRQVIEVFLVLSWQHDACHTCTLGLQDQDPGEAAPFLVLSPVPPPGPSYDGYAVTPALPSGQSMGAVLEQPQVLERPGARGSAPPSPTSVLGP
jgi:hypothetical protein